VIGIEQADRARRLARLRALRCLYKSYCNERLPAVRARRLLHEWLSPYQGAQLRQFGYFEVTGGKTGKRYRIMEGNCANVLELDDKGEPVRGWCFVPAGGLRVTSCWRRKSRWRVARGTRARLRTGFRQKCLS
jgi:hypothetical protein